MPDPADYAHLLPSDLSLGERLQGSGVYGDVFRVEQASPSSIPLVIRFISTQDIGTPYREPLAQRLELLSRGAMSHVSHIVRYGWQGEQLWLVTDQYRSRLWDKLHPHEPASVADAERIFLQMLTGLETLHDLGIAHGDLRSKNIFLATNGEQEIAWVGDGAIGCFSWWTGSKILENDSLRYAVPGQDASSAGKPSFNHDLYALGLIGCEMVLGHAMDRSSLDVINKQLKEAKVSPSLHQLIVLLLRRGASKEPYRCGLVRAAWQDQLARQRQRSTNMLRFIIAIMLVVMALLAWTESSTRTTNLSLQDQLSEQIDAQTNLVDKIDDLEAQVRHLRQNPPKESTVAPVTETDANTNTKPSAAQSRWQDVVQAANKKANGETPDASTILQAYQDLKSKEDPKSDPFSAELNQWSKTIRAGIMNDFYRTNRDHRLTSLLNDYAQTPWDDNAKEAVDARVDALKQAQAEWETWAQNSYSWDEVNRQCALIKDPIQNDILSGWLKALSSRTSWNLRLISGDAAPGWDVYRVIRIYVNGKQQGDRYNNTWKDETHHDYDRRNDSNTMPFTWKPDQTFGISLEQNGYAYNENMIDVHYHDPFDGALALWKANDQGETREGSSVLKFEIPNCPGPPSRQEIQSSSNPAKSP